MSSATQVKQRQWLIFIISVLLIYGSFQAIVWFVSTSRKPDAYKEKLTHFNIGSKPVKVMEHWQAQVDADNKKLKAELKNTTQLLKEQTKTFKEQQQLITNLQSRLEAIKTTVSLQQYNKTKNTTENAADGVFTIGTNTSGTNFNHNTNSPFPSTQHYASPSVSYQAVDNNQVVTPELADSFKVQHIKLERSGKVTYSADSYVASGSYVRAVVMGGMMAGAGTDSQGEPRPMLLEVIDYAKMPNKFQRNVKSCRIIASGYGDISSKRAFIRAHNLSCVMKNKNVFEKDIEAYIAGGDSMAGINGKVIRNEKAIIQNLFLAGFLGTGGDAIQQTLGSTSTSALGAVHTKTKKDILPGMLAGGLSNSTNELQKLFIEMAKQHHPVIQVTPGQEVTVVFLKGLSFKGAL